MTEYIVETTDAILGEILRERVHAVYEKGFTPDHDDEHGVLHLIRWATWYASTSYNAVPEAHLGVLSIAEVTDRDKLIAAAQLLVAAIEHVDRVKEREPDDSAVEES